MMKYKNQASDILMICQILLSTLFKEDNQLEMGYGVMLDSVSQFINLLKSCN